MIIGRFDRRVIESHAVRYGVFCPYLWARNTLVCRCYPDPGRWPWRWPPRRRAVAVRGRPPRPVAGPRWRARCRWRPSRPPWPWRACSGLSPRRPDRGPPRSPRARPGIPGPTVPWCSVRLQTNAHGRGVIVDGVPLLVWYTIQWRRNRDTHVIDDGGGGVWLGKRLWHKRPNSIKRSSYIIFKGYVCVPFIHPKMVTRINRGQCTCSMYLGVAWTGGICLSNSNRRVLRKRGFWPNKVFPSQNLFSFFFLFTNLGRKLNLLSGVLLSSRYDLADEVGGKK